VSRRRYRLAVASALAAFASATLIASSSARTAATPIYVAPSPKAPQTMECQNLAYCYGVRGPWVVIPAGGEATFLFGCPEQAKELGAYLLGGADALASSQHVHVWYDGWLGTPIGRQTPQSSTTGLLFHAVTDNGQPASFQPVLGCINLIQSSKLSTVSEVRPATPVAGTHIALPPSLRASLVVLEPGWDRPISVSCPSKESLVGSWGAATFGTQGPPIFPRARPVTITTVDRGNTVHALVRTASWVPYLIRVQIGAMCEP
jgi:hypothetical protein